MIEFGCDVKNDWCGIRRNSDIDMYLFIEKGLRGGISYVCKRHSEAYNKYMKNDPTKLSKVISDLDMNNLYSRGMSKFLPYGRFKWLKNFDDSDVNKISEKSPVGCILKVDLEYPDELHRLHNDYPLAPENLHFAYDILSYYCKKPADRYGIKVGDVKKLIPNLGEKTNYVVHYRNLQLHLSLGMKLAKTHKVLKFKQSDWMKIYIDFNTEKRKNAVIVLKKSFLS